MSHTCYRKIHDRLWDLFELKCKVNLQTESIAIICKSLFISILPCLLLTRISVSFNPPSPAPPEKYLRAISPLKAKCSPAGKQRLFLDLVLAEKQILAIDWPQRAFPTEEGFVCRLLRKRTLHKSTALTRIFFYKNNFIRTTSLRFALN